MIFDTTLVTPSDGWIAIAVFICASILIWALLYIAPQQFRVPKRKNIYYAGVILVASITSAAVYILHSWKLSLGLISAMMVASYIGRIDEVKKLSAIQQLLFQGIIAIITVLAGWVIPYISNPFHNGIIFLNYPILGIIPGAILAFIWIIACMNAINFLDGTDGLASSIGMIACIALAGISLLPATQDMRTFKLAIIGFAALASFFIWNAPRAKIYLGTTGSWGIGLYIALISMIGGGKISTTLIVLALPVLDALFVIIHRIYSGVMPWHGDTTRHIHHRLAHAGMSKWNIVILISSCTLLLASISIIASTLVKIIAFIVFAAIFFAASFRMMKKAYL
ncbi:MAG TPA: MraY family glycosyltransferase [Candidatus Andersenbacteria bacterium]|nr:MraY family glycosyltransferase [Candidatus Andersenbacteria bacterium]